MTQLHFFTEEEQAPQPGEEAPARPWRPDLRLVEKRDLPPAFRSVADLVGLKPALAMVKWRGGTLFSVPSKARAAHALAAVLGPVGFRLLTATYGGDKLYLPTRGAVCTPARNRAIRREFDRGAAVTALVARFGLSERTIQTILTQPDTP